MTLLDTSTQHIKYALLSVSDKTGILEFAQNLIQLGYTILSTGGTAKLLQQNKINVTEVYEYTKFPEMLDGRVKTLNPKIHAGILAMRSNPEHREALAIHNIPYIDIVAVNLYPFTQSIADENCTLAHAIENIDIGGPTMLRAAAKNYTDVTVVVDVDDYQVVIDELTCLKHTSINTRFKLARKVFIHTARYDGAISNYLSSICSKDDSVNDFGVSKPKLSQFPRAVSLHYDKVQDLRYGENPHQQGAFYRDINRDKNEENNTQQQGIAHCQQLQGKELSYNNIADADMAWECVKNFHKSKTTLTTITESICVIVKHANPCGVGIGENSLIAYQKAWATDTTSAFGGIIACNQTIDLQAAQAILQQFVEVIIAPNYTQDALNAFSAKANIRLLQANLDNTLCAKNADIQTFDLRRVGQGLLIQTPDTHIINAQDLNIVTAQKPNTQQIQDMLFAWNVAHFVKSNAIVFCKDGQTLGIGAGQMSRVDSAKIACIKAQNAGLDLHNSAVASDAFFPFKDGLDVVADAGASCVIQPGGSIRDDEVIARANERNIIMAFTGIRHFKH
jgi:phosphoribosylaminoimidazolecarboxamide formyltransferase / IMP cyclohydrolase